MQLTDRYSLPPGSCFLCHSAQRPADGGGKEALVDTLVNVPTDMRHTVRVVICEACVTTMADLLGFSSPKHTIIRRETIASLITEVAHLQSEYAALVEIRDAVLAFQARPPLDITDPNAGGVYDVGDEDEEPHRTFEGTTVSAELKDLYPPVPEMTYAPPPETLAAVISDIEGNITECPECGGFFNSPHGLKIHIGRTHTPREATV